MISDGGARFLRSPLLSGLDASEDLISFSLDLTVIVHIVVPDKYPGHMVNVLDFFYRF